MTENLIAIAKSAVSRHAGKTAEKYFSRQDLEDIAGDVIYKACRYLDTFDPGRASFSTWVNGIARNCVKDALDHKMKRLPISGSLSARDDEGGWFSESEADRAVDRMEFDRCVWEEVGRLSEKNQRLVHMLYEGYAPKDMAAIEGCTPNAASKRLFEIRKILKKAMAQAGREYMFNDKKRRLTWQKQN